MNRFDIICFVALSAAAGVILNSLNKSSVSDLSGAATLSTIKIGSLFAYGEVGGSNFFEENEYSQSVKKKSQTVVHSDEDAEADLSLWPHLRNSNENNSDREKVKEQWENFAKIYPSNIFLNLRADLYSPTTPKEQMDQDAAIDASSRISLMKIQKESELPASTYLYNDPGVVMDYYDRRIKNVESAIQLLEFFLASGEASPEEKKVAVMEIEKLSNQLIEDRKLKSSISLQ